MTLQNLLWGLYSKTSWDIQHMFIGWIPISIINNFRYLRGNPYKFYKVQCLHFGYLKLLVNVVYNHLPLQNQWWRSGCVKMAPELRQFICGYIHLRIVSDWFCTFCQGKSPLNHQLGNMFFMCSNHLKAKLRVFFPPSQRWRDRCKSKAQVWDPKKSHRIHVWYVYLHLP